MRKTKTSTEVKRRYNEKTYDRITIAVRKDKAKAYKEKCDILGINYSDPLHEAIENFLKKS